ncbi:S1C family serine protease [Mucilaginibacter arboris]|uniref:Trypsin-like serine protease n=1 Tax=Mucilaginibacter arboris TaxID=2682090 RepID=A0A7K1SWZ3_9SPHI|nr:serine protease [Mucilaginibacter arboris]MVN21846.1 trypsin-like serine protease [Mucilaginibacter arboris]
MNEPQLLDLIERYLGHELSGQEQIEFERMRKSDAVINNRIKEHQQFLKYMADWNERLEFENTLNAIHEEIDVDAVKEKLGLRQGRVVTLWRNHHSKISVAASVAIFAVMLTLFFTGYFNNQNQQSKYSALRRDLETVKRSQNALIRDITGKSARKKNLNPGDFGGTGFAINTNGDIITNFHVINGADSVYVQNSNGDSYKAVAVYTNADYDLAVLHITDTSFKRLSAVPYAFKKSKADLGEDVFTLGYPKDSVVIGKGYLSSFTGYDNDSLAYQVSIPVNPGNSGGPLLDSYGNVIGIIKGKQTQVDGAAFATKSSYLMKAIQEMPADSTGKKIVLNSKNSMSKLTRSQQIKKLQNYVFMVKVYN